MQSSEMTKKLVTSAKRAQTSVYCHGQRGQAWNCLELYLAIFSGVTYSSLYLQTVEHSSFRISCCFAHSILPLKYAAGILACRNPRNSDAVVLAGHEFHNLWIEVLTGELTSDKCMIWSIISDKRGQTTSVTPGSHTAGSCKNKYNLVQLLQYFLWRHVSKTSWTQQRQEYLISETLSTSSWHQHKDIAATHACIHYLKLIWPKRVISKIFPIIHLSVKIYQLPYSLRRDPALHKQHIANLKLATPWEIETPSFT